MFRYGINPLKLRAIFVSHLHADHVYGIFPLLSTMSLYGRKTALKIYAPAPFGAMLDSYKEFFGGDVDYEVEWVEVDCTKHQIIFENRTLEVWSVPLRHRLPTSGYLFREKRPPLNVDKFKITKYNLSIAQITAAKRGEDVDLSTGERINNSELTYTPHEPRGYAYISDTAYAPPVAKMCHGIDLLYHEATYAAVEAKTAKERGHSTTHQAAKCAEAAEVGRLIIGHFSSRYKDLTPLIEECREIFPQSELALEGEEFVIEKRS